MFSYQEDYTKKLIHELNELVFIMFDDGFPKCCSRSISDILATLRKLSKQYSEIHDKIISANYRYECLANLFPDWQDVNQIQQKMALKSLPSIISPSVYPDSYHPECNMM